LTDNLVVGIIHYFYLNFSWKPTNFI